MNIDKWIITSKGSSIEYIKEGTKMKGLIGRQFITYQVFAKTQF